VSSNTGEAAPKKDEREREKKRKVKVRRVMLGMNANVLEGRKGNSEIFFFLFLA
jgi:hypothetical protein